MKKVNYRKIDSGNNLVDKVGNWSQEQPKSSLFLSYNTFP